MKTADTAARPILTLRRYVEELESSITLCLADPQPRAAHHLRTSTRRIEAQLTLLSLLPNLTLPEKVVNRVRKHLRELRRAAGRVRDLDVQLGLLDDPASLIGGTASTQLQRHSHKLRSFFAEERQQEASELQSLLQQLQRKLTRSLERLFEVLKPFEPLTILASDLIAAVQSWFEHESLAVLQGKESNAERLHDIRKSAKLARYMLESAPASARKARKLARAFEEVQQSGGRWHDWLTLFAQAGQRLGKKSPLTGALMRHRDTSLAGYRAHLKTIRQLHPRRRTRARGPNSRKLVSVCLFTCSRSAAFPTSRPSPSSSGSSPRASRT
ncbi:CHAD domain-containing protein [Granulicella sp. WH15]|uniref:CHAD domain-containing protein n=1 Tax=Granulicella sp. WH15 TaxID=2602070 RepID=UPI001366E32F|nr:CHAD domain-containing protein [Granulicella sp. WH15]QHN01947.1 CHAD domain-containing protein [Granulicella sp. WH15]